MKQQTGLDTDELSQMISATVEKTLQSSIEEKLQVLQEEIQQFKQRASTATNSAPIDSAESYDQPEAARVADDASFQLIEYLKNEGLEVIDKRAHSGTIWVVGGWELKDTLFALKQKKIYFRFAKKGSRSTRISRLLTRWGRLKKYLLN